MNELLVYKILAIAGLMLFTVAFAWATILHIKNRLLLKRIADLEKPKEPEKPKKPSRVVVRIKDSRCETVYGSRFGYRPDGALEITDHEGLICAVFGAGKWMSAIVESEPKVPKPVEGPKEAIVG